MKSEENKRRTKANREQKPLRNVKTGTDAQIENRTNLSGPTERPKGAVEVELSEEECADVKKTLSQMIGFRGIELVDRIIIQVKTLQVCGPSDLDTAERFISAAAMMKELEPENATQAFLAVQMIGVHEAAVTFLRNATAKGQTFDGADANVVRATRLMRLFTEQLEAMAKLKGKRAQQKVTVEHVHVHQGGQAIVGAVSEEKSDDPGVGKHEK